MVYASEETVLGVGVGAGFGVGEGFGVGFGVGVADVVGDGVGLVVGLGVGVGLDVDVALPAALGLLLVVVLAGLAVSAPVDPAPPQADNDSMAAKVKPPTHSRDLLIDLNIIALLNISISFLYPFDHPANTTRGDLLGILKRGTNIE